MSTQKALVLQGDKKASVVSDRPLPQPRPGYIGVKVTDVALNPTDWKHIDYLNQAGCLSGCDYAGVVESTGEGYAKQWKKGDRIAGMAHGGNKLQPEDGAFAEHIMVKADAQFKVPDSMPSTEAATLGVGLMTCGQGLFEAMGLNLPTNPTTSGELVLIYGGSTATGSLGIQLVKLAGYTPITTCSPRNFAFVKSLGAAEAFDYNDPECAAKIRSYANNNLKFCWDCISLESSAKICADVIAPGGKYGVLLGQEWPREDVKMTYTLAYTSLGEPVEKGPNKIPASSDNWEFSKKWVAICDQLLQDGKIKVHRPKVGTGGFEGVLEGLDLLRKDKVSGEKLVYSIA